MKGYIYKLYGDNHSLVYYGSTIQPLSRRLAGHKRDMFTGVTSRFLFHTGEPVKICLMEIVEYEDKMQLKSREAYYIKNFDCVNKNNPCIEMSKKEYCLLKSKEPKAVARTKKYREKNKDKISTSCSEYYEKNKDQFKLRESKRIVTYNDCECSGRFTNKNKSTHLKSKKHQKYINKQAL